MLTTILLTACLSTPEPTIIQPAPEPTPSTEDAPTEAPRPTPAALAADWLEETGADPKGAVITCNGSGCTVHVAATEQTHHLTCEQEGCVVDKAEGEE